MTPFLHNISFSGVNMLSVYRENVPLLSRILADVMKYWAMGVTKLVTPLKIMNFSQIEEAFRIMQTGKHIGKMVLAANDDDIVPVRHFYTTGTASNRKDANSRQTDRPP